LPAALLGLGLLLGGCTFDSSGLSRGDQSHDRSRDQGLEPAREGAAERAPDRSVERSVDRGPDQPGGLCQGKTGAVCVQAGSGWQEGSCTAGVFKLQRLCPAGCDGPACAPPQPCTPCASSGACAATEVCSAFLGTNSSGSSELRTCCVAKGSGQGLGEQTCGAGTDCVSGLCATSESGGKACYEACDPIVPACAPPKQCKKSTVSLGSDPREVNSCRLPAPTPDAGKPDAPKPDAGQPDAPKPDAPKADTAAADAPRPDAPAPDAAQADSASPDTSTPDASGVDAALTPSPSSTRRVG